MILEYKKEDGTIINIEWEQGDQYDDAGDGHCRMYFAIGTAEDGSKWQGSWVEVDDECEEIEDIEEAE